MRNISNILKIHFKETFDNRTHYVCRKGSEYKKHISLINYWGGTIMPLGMVISLVWSILFGFTRFVVFLDVASFSIGFLSLGITLCSDSIKNEWQGICYLQTAMLLIMQIGLM